MSKPLIGNIHRSDAIRLLQRLDDESVAAVILDPPERVGVHVSSEMSVADSVLDTMSGVGEEVYRVLMPGGAVLVMGGHYVLSAWDILADGYGFRLSAEIVVLWIYPRCSRPTNGLASLTMPIRWYRKPGLRDGTVDELVMDSNVVICHMVHDDHLKNPAQKPVELYNYLISHLTYPGDLIVDPFCGAGSSLVAATMCDRKFIGGDVDSDQVRYARARLVALDMEPMYMHDLETWSQGRKTKIKG